MGGKKKGLANRLAKMSDEERARYMQMKADQEEEARRRKEQLVQAFMKNKIKREDNFARLNKAKINQQWHQFMRLRKCREMKENCEHTKKWIERVVALKNRTIDNLMKELDEAEFQYSTNLQAHLQHVDNFIGNSIFFPTSNYSSSKEYSNVCT
ncbi:nyd-sp28 protein [Holotrichia oblita]|uniref:Nyd-sp28 protein n=1 Tax=Holotrichia oblita TaxID=644536 RepID=A0ACB9SNQ9_HOLOL|nr:nyd-sp28 protein [Holotrichia oblita]